jgi:hypothetical protein
MTRYFCEKISKWVEKISRKLNNYTNDNITKSTYHLFANTSIQYPGRYTTVSTL